MHGNRGRKDKHALTDEFKDKIETLYTSKYFDCTYTQFTEYLAEREHISLSVSEVGQILRERYVLSPRARKITKKNLKKKLHIFYYFRSYIINVLSFPAFSTILGFSIIFCIFSLVLKNGSHPSEYAHIYFIFSKFHLYVSI